MTDEAYDSGVISSDGTCSGQECAPASGAQGTVKMKVSNPVKKGTKRTSTGTSIAGGASESAPINFKLQLLDRKLKNDKMRQDAAFAAKLLKNPNLSSTLTSHAEDILLAFLTKVKDEAKSKIVTVSSDDDV